MTGFGTLGSTTDPLALVPGSVDTLRADAQDLRTRAAELDSEAEGPVRRPVSAWTGEAADRAAERRTHLATALGGVADVYRTVATVLDAHAQVLGWAQAQAHVAIELWAAGIDAAAAAGEPTFLLRPRTTGLFGLNPGASAVVEADPGAPLRRRAETVLATATREVTLSQAAAARVLDQFSDGLPDGRFHFEEFLAGIGDWIIGLGELVWKFNSIRLYVDGDAMISDAVELGQGMWDTGAYLIDNPGETVPVLFDTQTMHDNPGRWWGRLAPDIALTAAAGVGLATRGGSTAVRGADFIDDLTDAGRAENLLDGVGSRWADPAARQQWVDDLANNYPQRPVRTSEAWGQYQVSHTGPVETHLSGGGRQAWVDGVVLDADTVAAAEVKFVTTPQSSPYTGTMPPFLQERALAQLDDQLLRYRAIMDDPGNPVERLRLITNDPDAAQYVMARARQVIGEGADIVVEVRP